MARAKSSVPATIDEARKLGAKKIEKPKTWDPEGIHITPVQPRGICYIGPCVNGAGTVCYSLPPAANGGCNECVSWADPHCQ